MSHASELRLGNGAGAGLPRSVPRHREAWRWGISAPAALSIFFLLILPLAWLIWLSVRQGD
ncbi:MAG: hypothetical protein AB7L76_07545, partial [Burkholderiaceae bacterium]